MALGSLVDSPLPPLGQADPNNLIGGYTPPTGGGLESSFDSGGTEPLFGTSFGLLQRPDENIERQYFYNKDLNKLFNMPIGVRMAAPKGFESVNKDQYEDFASKGATLQGASMFNDAMGGGYNLDLPRLTSGENSGQVDRNSPEFLYYYGDQQQPKLPPKLSLGPADPANLGSTGGPSLFANKIGGIENTAIASLPQPTEGVSQDVLGNPNILAPSDQRPVVDDASMKGLPETNEPPMFATTNPFNRVGQQLMGPNQDEMLGTLKNIEQGIASLVGNYGQDFNSNKSSNYGDFDNFGMGSFFPPYGGMYG